jgi:sec-independent protein translocase protein TatA
MPFNIGFGELLLVLIVALLVFGGRLPEVGRSLGRGLMEFKEGLKGVKDMADDTLDEEEEDIGEPDEEDSDAAGDDADQKAD